MGFQKRLTRFLIILFIIEGIIGCTNLLSFTVSGQSIFESLHINILALLIINMMIIYLLAWFSNRMPWRYVMLITLYRILTTMISLPLSFIARGDLTLDKILIFSDGLVAGQVKWFGIVRILFFIVQILAGLHIFGKISDKEKIYQGGTDLKRGLIIFAAHIMFFIFILQPYLLFISGVYIESITGGFIKADMSGLYSVQKDYTLSDSTVSLIGMMHIGDKEFYNDLLQDFSKSGSVIIPEGISDRGDLLKTKPDYKKVSKAIGLDSQSEEFLKDHEEWKFDPVDLDTSEFSDNTLNFINKIMSMLQNIEDREDLIKKLFFTSEEPPAMEITTFYKDVIEKRNEALWAGIQKNRGQYEQIIIPWGAYHLVDISQRLESMGHMPDNTVIRPLVKYSQLIRKKEKNIKDEAENNG
ncbi:MAG: hypothetical protein ACOCWO_02290 [Candidatus Muiribacteriaceae bacterium]